MIEKVFNAAQYYIVEIEKIVKQDSLIMHKLFGV